MIAALIVTSCVGYVLAAIVVGAASHAIYKKMWGNSGDADMATFFTAVFWPIAIPLSLIIKSIVELYGYLEGIFEKGLSK